jgi:hypothetical protein
VIRRPVIAAACLGLLVTTAVATPETGTAASTGTVSGTLRGASVPPKGRGVVVLRALRLDRGTIGGTRRVARSGAYVLRLQPGPYALFGTIVDRTATAAVTTRGPALTLRAGQRRAVPMRLRKPKPKHKRKRRRHSAKAAYFQEDGTETPGRIAYQILDFTGATGDLAMYNRALPEMLMTDTMGLGVCTTSQVAGPRDLAAVAAELELQRSPYFDPSTQVRRNWILPDVKVTGRLANRPGALAYVITIVDARTGATRGRVSGNLELTDLFDQLAPLAARIMDRVCQPPPPPQATTPTAPAPPTPPPAVDPDGLTGTFTGDVDYMTQPLTPLPIRITWSGTVDLARQEYGIAPAVVYTLRAGSVTATLDADIGDCDVNGTSTIDLLAANLGQPTPVLVVDLSGPAPVYRLALGAQAASIAAFKSNCADTMQNGQLVTWPLLATPLALTIEPRPVASRFAFNETLTGRPTPADPVYQWTWSLSGA